jgi:hypothetical protein
LIDFKVIEKAQGFHCNWCKNEIKDYAFESKGRFYHHECFDELEDSYYSDNKIYPDQQETNRDRWNLLNK